MTRVCSNDPTHDIGAAGATGSFCPVCGQRIVDRESVASGASDDLTGDEPLDLNAKPTQVELDHPKVVVIGTPKPPNRRTLYVAIGVVLSAAAAAAFFLFSAKPSPQRIYVANVISDHRCQLKNVVVTFWKDGHGRLEGQASGPDGAILIDYRIAQGPAPARQIIVSISAVLSSGGAPSVGTVIFLRQPSTASTKSFHYPGDLFAKIVDAKVQIQCST